MHPYFHINRQLHHSVTSKKNVLSLQIQAHMHMRILPHWTGQPDGLLGMMERLYKEMGFEARFEGNRRRRLKECRRKRVPDGRDLIAERTMSKTLQVFLRNFKQFFMTRSQ